MLNTSQAYAQDSITGFLRGTTTSKPYFAVFDIRPASVSTEAIQQAVAAAFRVHYGDIKVNQQMTPYPLPQGAPRMSFFQQNTSIGPVSMPHCIGMSAVISSADTSMTKYGEITVLQACVFAYKDGHRVNVYAFFGQKTGGVGVAELGSSLGRMFTSAVGLGDTSKFIGETIDDIEKRLIRITPNVTLVDLQPAREGKSIAVDPAGTMRAQDSATSQSSSLQNYGPIQGIQAAVAAQLKATDAIKQSNEMARPSGQQQMPQIITTVQARKDLSAMGLTYYSQEQFAEAVQREDRVACELFLQAGVVSVTKQGKNKRTPLQMAKSPELLDMLKKYQRN